MRIFVSICFGLVLIGQAAADVPKIMPFGDSLTAGWNQPSYRLPLARALQQHGCEFDFVGNQSLTSRTPHKPHKYPGLHFPSFSPDTHPGYAPGEHWDPSLGDDTDHAGYPGLNTAKLLKMAWVEARQAQPDYVLLHLGTNDVLEARGVYTGEDRVRFAIKTVSKINEIIQAVYASHQHPENVLILLANLAPGKPEQQVNEWLDEIRLAETLRRYIEALVKGKEDARLMLVDVASEFDWETMTTDGVHPNAKGERLLAQAFLNKLLETGFCYTPGMP